MSLGAWTGTLRAQSLYGLPVDVEDVALNDGHQPCQDEQRNDSVNEPTTEAKVRARLINRIKTATVT